MTDVQIEDLTNDLIKKQTVVWRIKMKNRLLIIGIVLASVGSGTYAYVLHTQSQCSSLPGYSHNPRMRTFEDCLSYLQTTQSEQPLEKNIKIEGKMADKICSIIGGDCPPYYPGNPQENGTVIVGYIIHGRSGVNAYYQFLIQNETLSYVKTVKQNEN
ncbi:MAG: hypothetical protein K8Q89_10280 [Nitrosarchaeum sp.]|nr:hypothetical protein [Nitrosarchaeum sp.]